MFSQRYTVLMEYNKINLISCLNYSFNLFLCYKVDRNVWFTWVSFLFRNQPELVNQIIRVTDFHSYTPSLELANLLCDFLLGYYNKFSLKLLTRR